MSMLILAPLMAALAISLMMSLRCCSSAVGSGDGDEGAVDNDREGRLGLLLVR
jgi:hypothetical protein